MSNLGARQITVSGSGPTALTNADAEALATLPGVQAVSTQVSGRGAAVAGATAKTISLTGVSPSYASIAEPDIAAGSFLPSWTGAEDTRTVVLSGQAADDLAATATSVGSVITIDGSAFTLVGILDDSTGFGVGGSAYVPLQAARSLFARSSFVSTISVQTADSQAVDAVQPVIDSTLRARHSLGADDDAAFSVTNQASLLSTVQTVQTTLSLLLGGIASISLIVGGIGIMNMMLVSVRERTMEIGVRRAIGARRSHILGQFIIEAVVLSLTGGLIGLGIGLVASAAIAQIGGWAFTVSATTVAVALGFSVAVGVVFGVWPARTAPRLQPVDALRYE